jgi:hypothetical protein
MKLVHRIVVAAVLAWLGSSGLALAEPISITSGVIALTRDATAHSPMTLSGTDGVRSFAFSGLLEAQVNYEARDCNPCGATATDVSIAILTNGGSHVTSRTGQKATRWGDSKMADSACSF